jgi:NADH:ubiquinone oxidoreductase subunit 5 (subunit L)/multisubunit Na+/H+ antiporter MnhA subunit
MLVNRVGDIGLVLAMFAILDRFGSLDFSSTLNMVVVSAPTSGTTLICLLLFVGAVGKSAQLGLHTWLPDAMEG